MEKLQELVVGWARRLAPAELAALAAAAIVIAVVPGALTAWIAWRLLRTRSAS